MKSNEYGKLELLRYSKNFSKKRIVQVDVVPEYSLLILLTGTFISIYLIFIIIIYLIIHLLLLLLI